MHCRGIVSVGALECAPAQSHSGSPMHLHAALITALNVLLLFVAMALVGRARGRYQIKAPAVTGNENFERVFRAHQNTLEQTVMFLPVLWLATVHANPLWAAGLGYLWLIGRAWYLAAYIRPGSSRAPGFTIALLAWLLLLALSLFGIVMSLFFF